MGIFIEALILYILLFLPGYPVIQTAGAAEFSIITELIKIFTRSIPSLCLIWYLIFKAGDTKIEEILPVKPKIENLQDAAFLKNADSARTRAGKKDLISASIALPSLILTGFIISLLSSASGGISTGNLIYSPSTAPEWTVLSLSCIVSAYLEESYFRFYLLTKRHWLRLNALEVTAVSVILFSACHIYAGFWGVLNAAISGTVLCVLFLRFNAIHGIAIAHAIYNILAFVFNS